jgi:hypothetical protein
MAIDGKHLIGQRVWFPSKWECGTLDSVLEGNDGKALAYVILRDNGKYHAVDMQTVEIKDAEE